MSGTLSQSIQIAATPEALWDLLRTAAGIRDWYDDWDAIEDASERYLHVGTSFRLVRRRGSSVESVVCRVTVVDEPHRLTWSESAPRQPPVSVDFQLEPDPETAGTLLTLSKHY